MSKSTVAAIHREQVAAEVRSREMHGMTRVTFAKLKELIGQLGYRFNLSMSCRGMARYVTGERAGQTYPNCSLYPVQCDNGMSYAHVDARRDANFEQLKVLRDTYFAVHAGRIYGW